MTNKAFKVGDTVREISTGDIGVVILRPLWLTRRDAVNVLWNTGDEAGNNLHIDINAIELVESAKTESEEFTAEQAREITAKIVQNEEYEAVIAGIKAKCSKGEFTTRVAPLEETTREKLIKAGFVILESAGVDYAVISWRVN